MEETQKNIGSTPNPSQSPPGTPGKEPPRLKGVAPEVFEQAARSGKAGVGGAASATAAVGRKNGSKKST